MEWQQKNIVSVLIPLCFIYLTTLLSGCPSTDQDNQESAQQPDLAGIWTGTFSDPILGESTARGILANGYLFVLLGDAATELYGTYTQNGTMIHAELTGFDQHTGLAYLSSSLVAGIDKTLITGTVESVVFSGDLTTGTLNLAPAAITTPVLNISEKIGNWQSFGHAIFGDIMITVHTDLSMDGYSSTGCLFTIATEPVEIGQSLYTTQLEFSGCVSPVNSRHAFAYFHRDESANPSLELLWDTGTSRPFYISLQRE